MSGKWAIKLELFIAAWRPASEADGFDRVADFLREVAQIYVALQQVGAKDAFDTIRGAEELLQALGLKRGGC
eukprot:3360094-Amphidinium_carterae.1